MLGVATVVVGISGGLTSSIERLGVIEFFTDTYVLVVSAQVMQ